VNEAVETLVIGAGISGLSYAYARGEHADYAVVDAGERPGGLVHTIAVDARPGLRYESGPEALSGSAGDVRELARKLDVPIHDCDERAAKRFVVKGGKPIEVPLAPPRLVTTKLLSTGAKLRLATEPWRDAKKALDGSIADFARHRLGPEVLETLVDPMVSGIHAGDPAELSLRACFPQLVAMIETHGSVFNALRARQKASRGQKPPGLWKPAGGMQRLTNALARRVGEKLHLSCKVRRIERVGRGYEVHTDRGRIEAMRVVLAVPLRAATRLLEGAVPEAAAVLGTMRAESLIAYFHAYERHQVDHPLDGFGYLVPHREGMRHLGTLFSSSIEPDGTPEGEVLLRTLAGGARDERLVEKSDAEIATVEDEVAGVLGIRGKPTWKRIVRYPEALPRLDLGHPERLARVHELLPANLGLLGNFTHGVGLSSLVERANALAASHRSGAGVAT